MDQILIAKCMIIILVVFVSLDITETHNKAVYKVNILFYFVHFEVKLSIVVKKTL